jgi:hypothetical protein
MQDTQRRGKIRQTPRQKRKENDEKMPNCCVDGKYCMYLMNEAPWCEKHPEKWITFPRSEVTTTSVTDGTVCGDYESED